MLGVIAIAPKCAVGRKVTPATGSPSPAKRNQAVRGSRFRGAGDVAASTLGPPDADSGASSALATARADEMVDLAPAAFESAARSATASVS